tara:strand:- start:2068 stop:2715 length:648 start_codon:yes stop_codon:yes gene_type:complete
MDEKLQISEEIGFFEKMKSFFIKNKKLIIIIFSFIFLLLISFFIFKEYKINQKIKISEEFNSTIIDYTEKNKDRTIKKLTNIIEKHDETYSPLSLYFIIDNNLIDEMTEINRLFDELINHVKLEEEIKNLIIYKKALYNSDKSDEFFLLNVLKPLINSDSIWKAHGLNLMGEFFYDKNEKEKSKEFFQQILQLDKINSDIKKNSQIRLQRDLGEK